MIVQGISANIHGVQATDELFGLEMEVENVRIGESELNGSHWNIIADGSLRGGLEFVSNPITYAQSRNALRMFYRWFHERNYATNVRTSMHVHYNVLGYDMPNLAAALTCYALVEPLLFRLCGEQREQNVYCVPWYRSEDDMRAVRGLAENLDNGLSKTCKYSALYLEPIYRFGTVEFRQAPVWQSYEEAMQWVTLVRDVIHNGAEYTSPRQVVDAFLTIGAEAFVSRLLSDNVAAVLLDTVPDIAQVLEDYDVIKKAEECTPELYTYKVTEAEWLQSPAVEGDKEAGYHAVAWQPSDYRPDIWELSHGRDEEDYGHDEEEW